MSASELSDRPAFQSADIAMGQDRVPVSTMAILSFVLGIISLLVLLSILFIPLCILAVILGTISIVRIAYDSEIGGKRLAQIGLGLGIMSATWSITAQYGQSKYLVDHAGNYAAEFLYLLSAGKKYEALELKRMEPERQITGTNLEAYYQNVQEEEKSKVDEFLKDPATLAVLNTPAKWTLLRGLDIQRDGALYYVTVDMKNEMPGAKTKVVRVTMERHLERVFPGDAKSKTLWNVAYMHIAP